MKTFYRVKSDIKKPYVNGDYYEAQYKPWWFPFFWRSCYGFNSCCYKETAEELCRLHSRGASFNEEELEWVIGHLDLEMYHK